MTSIVIAIRSSNQYSGDEGEVVHECRAIYGQDVSDYVDFLAYQDRDDLASTVNTAIKDAAIVACAGVSITVGALDKKTLMGGAVGL